jgi:small subunit ribosomal protein S8
MVVTDSIADMISRINNALARSKKEVDMPSSRIKQEIARLLKEEGYIVGYNHVEDKKQGMLRINLKYTEDGASVIRSIKRISKPGCRVYKNVDQMNRIIEGLGRAVITTSKGLLTDKECRKNKIGGEVLLEIW